MDKEGGRQGTPGKARGLREGITECGGLWDSEVTDLIGQKIVQV